MMKSHHESASLATEFAVFDVSSADLADWADFSAVFEDDAEPGCVAQQPTMYQNRKEMDDSGSDASETEPVDEQMQLIHCFLVHFVNPLMTEMQNQIIKFNMPMDQPTTVNADLGEWMQQHVSNILFDPSGGIKSSLSSHECTKLQQICEVVGKQTFKRPHVSVEVLVGISKWLKKAGVKEDSVLWVTFYKLLNRSRSSVSKRKRQGKVEAMEVQRNLVQHLEQLARDVRLLVSKTIPDISEALDATHQHVFMQLYLESLHSVDQMIAEQYAEYMRREEALQDDEIVPALKQPRQRQQHGQESDVDSFMNVLAIDVSAGAENDLANVEWSQG